MGRINAENTPIIIPCYKRPEFLERCLNNLSQCNSIEKFTVLFSFDRKDENDAECQEVLKLCESWNCSEKIIFYRDNIWHGSLNSTGSICFIMNEMNYEDGGFIYIEEDICVSKHYLDFCIDALNFYKDNHHVMMIAGNNTEEYEDIELPVICSLNQICTCSILWGMASWWNRWQWIDKNLKSYCENPATIKNDLFENTVLPEINCHLREDGTMRNRAGGGLITASMLMNGSLCLHPDYALSDHIGWYGWHIPKDAEHSSEGKPLGTANSFHIENMYNYDFPNITKQHVADNFSVDIEEMV